MMCTSTQSRSHLSPTQVSIFVFHLYLGNIKPWSRSRDLHLTSKEAPSHLRPGRRIRVSAPTRCHLTPFQVWNLHLNPIYVLSLPHLHPGHISYQSKPKYLHLTSIQVMSIAHVRHTSIQVLSHLHPNSNILISPPPMYCLTSIQVRSFVSHLHPCDISPPAYSLPFKSWYLHHSSILVLSHTNPCFDISAWTPPRSRLTSIQVPWLAFHIHPSRPSTLSCCILIPARPHLNPIQVSGWASQLHPCPGSPPFSFL